MLTCDGGGTSTDVSVVLGGEPTLTTEGTVGAYPSKIPMIDVVTVGAGGGSIAWISPEGTLKVGPKSAGADPGPICYAKGGAEPTITDAHVMLGRIPAHLLGGEIPLDADERPAPASSRTSPGSLGLARRRVRRRASSRSRRGTRPTPCARSRVKRGLDVRDFMLATFGGSGSLLACRLVDILDLAGVVVPPNPGNVSAFGLLTVDVKNDYVQTAVAKHAPSSTTTRSTRRSHELTERAAQALDGEGFPPGPTTGTSARPTCATSARPSRCGSTRPRVRSTRPSADAVATAFHDAHKGPLRLRLPRRPAPASRVGQLACHRHRPDHPARRSTRSPLPRSTTRGAGPPGTPGLLRGRPGYVDTGVYWRPDCWAGDEVAGPAIVEEFGSTVPVHPGFIVRVDAYGNLVITKEACDVTVTAKPPRRLAPVDAAASSSSARGTAGDAPAPVANQPPPHGLRARGTAHRRG